MLGLFNDDDYDSKDVHARDAAVVKSVAQPD
jgi:hypothetical protein